MREFRPRSSRPGRFWPWVLVWVCMVIAYLIWIGWPKTSTVGATLDHSINRSVANVSVTYTGQDWNNKPVYVLKNFGADLEHVNLYNWAEDQLPVLFVGFSAPNNLFTQSALASPPYQVPHLARIWFVSSMPPPTTFTVTWDEQGNVHFTTVKVPAASPSNTVPSKGSLAFALSVKPSQPQRIPG